MVQSIHAYHEHLIHDVSAVCESCGVWQTFLWFFICSKGTVISLYCLCWACLFDRAQAWLKTCGMNAMQVGHPSWIWLVLLS